MQKLMEYIPIIVFFIAYKAIDIYYAAGALVVGYLIILAFNYFTHKPIKKTTIYLFLFTLVMAGLTIAFQDEAFLKWKFSLVYFAIGSTLLISRYLMKTNLIKKGMAENLTLPDKIWDNVNIAWIGFFYFCASLNIYVFNNWSLDVWVNFKVFGALIMMIVYMFLTILYIYPHLPDEDQQ